MRMCDATERQGNCMRHSQIAHQAAARQCPGTVNAVAANDPPKPHRDGPRGHTQARDDTTTFSTVFPAPASWKRATQPPLFAYPPRWRSPPSTATFPRQQADKSLHNHHVLSILIVGPNQLKHRLSRINKPKSHPSSNTQCPITPGPRVGPIGGRRTTHWAIPPRTSRNAEGPTSRSTPRRIPSTQCTFAQIAPQKIHADAATMADVAFPCMPLL